MSEPITIDRYEIFEELGVGGFGSVYRARHRVMQRDVALKVLHNHAERERFLQEASILARIEHENIVRIFDSGVTDDGAAFLALELLHGETLAHRLRTTGRQPATEATWILCGVLRALEVAHEAGIVHRDLKHPNIFLAVEGGTTRVKVLDFGIARVADGPRMTASKVLVGTPRYSAPELIQGATASPASDIWGAGLVLYEMLAGRYAYPGASVHALASIMRGPPENIRTVVPGIDEAVAAILDVALAPTPGGRWRSAAAFRAALESTTRGSAPKTTAMQVAVGALGGAGDDVTPDDGASPTFVDAAIPGLPGRAPLATMAARPSKRPQVQSQADSLRDPSVAAPAAPATMAARPSKRPQVQSQAGSLHDPSVAAPAAPAAVAHAPRTTPATAETPAFTASSPRMSSPVEARHSTAPAAPPKVAGVAWRRWALMTVVGVVSALVGGIALLLAFVGYARSETDPHVLPAPPIGAPVAAPSSEPTSHVVGQAVPVAPPGGPTPRDPFCNDRCYLAQDGDCDDGRPGSITSTCFRGSDCSDCGPLTGACNDTCPSARDGSCDDGGTNSKLSVCALGTDCTDCGPG